MLRPLAASLLLVAFTLPACSSFDRQWDRTPSTVGAPAASLAGKWEGSWQSGQHDYYSGLARMILTQTEAPSSATGLLPQKYDAQFKLTHFFLFGQEFAMDLQATPDTEGRITFHAEREISPLEGMARFDGYVQSGAFYCTYSSRKDYGTITLRQR